MEHKITELKSPLLGSLFVADRFGKKYKKSMSGCASGKSSVVRVDGDFKLIESECKSMENGIPGRKIHNEEVIDHVSIRSIFRMKI